MKNTLIKDLDEIFQRYSTEKEIERERKEEKSRKEREKETKRGKIFLQEKFPQIAKKAAQAGKRSFRVLTFDCMERGYFSCRPKDLEPFERTIYNGIRSQGFKVRIQLSCPEADDYGYELVATW